MSVPHLALEAGQCLTAAAHWESLADDEDRAAAAGVTHANVAKARAETYRRAAAALRIEATTGQPVCVCCHKPVQRLDLLGREVSA